MVQVIQLTPGTTDSDVSFSVQYNAREGQREKKIGFQSLAEGRQRVGAEVTLSGRLFHRRASDRECPAANTCRQSDGWMDE